MQSAEDHLGEMFETLASVMKAHSDDIAEMQYEMFESLQEAGFTEDQAMQLLTSMDMGLDE